MMATVLLVGCSEPIGPGSSVAADTSSTADVVRREPQQSLPDTVRIPPFPIPPIFEELPQVEDSPS
jgi:hypothetical protein